MIALFAPSVAYMTAHFAARRIDNFVVSCSRSLSIVVAVAASTRDSFQTERMPVAYKAKPYHQQARRGVELDKLRFDRHYYPTRRIDLFSSKRRKSLYRKDLHHHDPARPRPEIGPRGQSSQTTTVVVHRGRGGESRGKEVIQGVASYAGNTLRSSTTAVLLALRDARRDELVRRNQRTARLMRRATSKSPTNDIVMTTSRNIRRHFWRAQATMLMNERTR